MINGTRLVYGMEEEAMRFLNLLGIGFLPRSCLVLGQYVKDTLCGTKRSSRGLRKDHGAAGRDQAEDPYGDFDFLLGGFTPGLKIVNVPVRYGRALRRDEHPAVLGWRDARPARDCRLPADLGPPVER